MVWLISITLSVYLIAQFRFDEVIWVVLFLLWLSFSRQRIKQRFRQFEREQRTRQQRNQDKAERLGHLGELQAELARAHQAGELNDADYQAVLEQLMRQYASYQAAYSERERQHRLQQTWLSLDLRDAEGNRLLPPWTREEAAQDSEPDWELAAETPLETAPQAVAPPVVATPRQTEPARPAPPPKPQAKPQAKPKTKPLPRRWLPPLPSVKAAFFTQILLPFLWQNIGWFIGAFMVVSGSIFFVTYTTGYYKALAVLATLGAYTALLLWGAYQIRRRRPELYLTTLVLGLLGVLLIPLLLAAATRLLLTGEAALSLGLGAALALATVLGSAFGLRLASGLIERSLLPEQPRLLLALAGLQLLLPLLPLWPHWSTLAVLHGVILLILLYALHRFSRRWLRSLFVDRQKIAWYAAGSLLYAALVSFVHLTWGSGIALPQGYAAPFLMALCGLLFYIDGQIQNWAERLPRLHWFSFVIYGLSVAALLPAWFAPAPWLLSLTLGLAALLYAGMLWRYLSLAPFYLLLAASSGLYYLLLLRHFPADTHFLFSLPGFYALLGLHKLALRHPRGENLARIVYRSLLSLIAALVLWSLAQGEPGLAAMGTPLAAALLVVHLIGLTPERLLARREDSGLNAHRCYFITGLFTLTLAYAPIFLNAWAQQFSFGLLLLGLLWNELGLRQAEDRYCRAVVLRNSALLSLLGALGLAWGLETMPYPAWLSLGGALLLLRLGVILRLRGPVYLGVALAAAGLMSLREYYGFISTGSSAALGALACWALWWWLRRRLVVMNALGGSAESAAPVTLVWIWRCTVQPNLSRLFHPLAWQGTVLCWALSLYQLAAYLYGPAAVPLKVALAAGLIALSTLLLAAQTQRALRPWPLLLLPPLALWLLLLALSAGLGLPPLWDTLLLSAAALLLWLGAALLLPRLRPLWQALDWSGACEPRGAAWWVEYGLHWGAAAMLLFGNGYLFTLSHSDEYLFFAQTLAALFFWLSGERYRLQSHAYLFVLAAIMSLFSLLLWHLPGLLRAFGEQSPLLLFSALSLGLSLLAWGRAPGSLYRLPLYHFAYLAYALNLAALSLLAVLDRHSPDASLLGFALLALWLSWPLFAAPRNGEQGYLLSRRAAAMRAILIPLGLLLIWLYGVPHVAVLREPLQLGLVSLLIALLLWATATFLLPLWNAWAAVGARVLPEVLYRGEFGRGERAGLPLVWLGLSLMLLSLPPAFLAADFDSNLQQTLLAKLPPLLAAPLEPLLLVLLTLGGWPWLSLLGLSLYLVLMQAHLNDAWLRWTSSLLLLLSGVVILLHLFPLQIGANNALLVGLLLWLNALFALAAWPRLACCAPYLHDGLRHPLRFWPYGFLLLWFVAIALPLFAALLNAAQTGATLNAGGLALLLCAALSLSLLHAAWRAPQGLKYSVWLLSLLLFVLLGLDALGLPLALSFALWLGLLLILESRAERLPLPGLQAVVSAWFGWNYLAAWGLLLWLGDAAWDAWGLLMLLSLAALWRGWRGADTPWWRRLGLLQAWLGLHWLWLLVAGLEWTDAPRLLSVYALQNALLAWAAFELRARFAAKLWPSLAHSAPALLGVSLLCWLGAAAWFSAALLGFVPEPGALSHAAQLAAALLLGLLWFGYQSGANRTLTVYAGSLLLLLAAAYARLVWLGFAPFTPWDTAGLMGAALLPLLLQRLLADEDYQPPLYHVALLLPLLALLTAPPQLASLHASLSLFAAAALYLALGREQGRGLPTLLALLTLNLGFYVWIPHWAEQAHLLQLYTIPAALTVLLMLHWHMLELRPSLRNSVRLGALSLLYASATLDVFLRPELAIFLLALGLSLGGVLLGIALRVRAFLYSGTVFLVLNVLGQLLNHYPQDTLGKGIVLLLLGGLITGGMIVFSLWREAIMRRLRIARADLAEWE